MTSLKSALGNIAVFAIQAGLPYGSLEKPKLRLEKTVSKSVSSERDKTRVHITFRSHLPELGMVKVALPL